MHGSVVAVRAGFLVAVCGIDGSGKSTQVENIADYLRVRFTELMETRQPTDRYRQDSVVRSALNLEVQPEQVATELALFSAFDRLRHIREEVEPVLARGGAVITDRYVYSTYAYFLARGIQDIVWLREINRYAPEPDLTVYLDVPPELAVQRIINRDGSSKKREEIDLDRMRSVRNNFVEQPWGATRSFKTIDGTSGREEVWATIKRYIDEALSRS